MRSIAALQNRIRTAKDRLSVYKEAARNLHRACGHLRLVDEGPRAYVRCLVEAVRRRAHYEHAALHAQRFAEAMADVSAQEAARRQTFEEHHAGLVPSEVFGALGLGMGPPRCEVHVLPTLEDAMEEMAVAPEDIPEDIGGGGVVVHREPPTLP